MQNTVKQYIEKFMHEDITNRIDSTARTASDTLHAIHDIQNQSHVDAENPELNRATITTPAGNSISIRRTNSTNGSNPNYKKVVQALKENHPELLEEIESLEKEFRQPFTRKAREIASVSNSDGTTARYSRVNPNS